MIYTVYIPHSIEFDKIYIGYTGNMEQRLLSHNEVTQKGWKIKFRPWKLVHTEEFKTKREPLRREKQLKSSRGRDWIRNTLLAGNE